MEKKILIWTIKGGCGKTNISAELALRFNYPAITNEKGSMLSHILSEERIKILSDNEEAPNYDVGMIFDFGGYIDNRIKDIARKSDFVIIPTLPEVSDIQGCINTVQNIKKFNRNIVIIANKTKGTDDVNFVKETINEIEDLPVFEIKESRALPNIYIEKKSIQKMMKDNPLLRYSYRKINKQFCDLSEYLLKIK